MVSPGPAMTRLTRRVPSLGEKKTTISPRCGVLHSARRQRVNGTLRSNASLFTKTRSPSRMVGFIEPLGTQFQSAIADFRGKINAATTAAGLSHSRQRYAKDFLRAGDLTIL